MKQSNMLPINAQSYIAKDELGPTDDFSATFKSEIDAAGESPKPEQAAPGRKRAAMRRLPVVVLGASVVLAGGWFAWHAWAGAARANGLPLVVADGTAVFNSVPQGASIAIDGTPRGVTPLRVSLATGSHNI